MKLALALACAKQRINPEYQGNRFAESGIYRARNGQYMTGPKLTAPTNGDWLTYEEFIAKHS